MPETLPIHLDEVDAALLEAKAKAQGKTQEQLAAELLSRWLRGYERNIIGLDSPSSGTNGPQFSKHRKH